MAERHVRIGEQTIAIDDSAFTVELTAGGDYLVSDGNRRWRVVVTGPPEERWIWVDGRVARVEIVARSTRSARARASAQDMSAPMPATVVNVLVVPGAAVEKGTPVVMLEAMKMELAVRAATSGVVRKVHCRPGDLVQPGVPLVEIDS